MLAAIVIRVLLLPTEGLRDDTDQFAGWVAHIATNGLPNAYDQNLSFGPVMAYIWALLGVLEPAFRTATDASDTWLRMLLKLPAVLADFGLAACVAWILREKPVWAGIAAVAVLLHPATWYVSAWWGQYESVYVLAALLAVLFAVGGRDGFAAAALAVAVLTKPQALPFLLPFAAWFLARGGIRGLLRAAAIGAAVAFVIWLPFLAAGGPLRYLGNLGEYQNDIFSVMSLRAWNFWWIVQELRRRRRVRVGPRVDHRADLVPRARLRRDRPAVARTSRCRSGAIRSRGRSSSAWPRRRSSRSRS